VAGEQDLTGPAVGAATGALGGAAQATTVYDLSSGDLGSGPAPLGFRVLAPPVPANPPLPAPRRLLWPGLLAGAVVYGLVQFQRSYQPKVRSPAY
jgi:hypothetical protein